MLPRDFRLLSGDEKLHPDPARVKGVPLGVDGIGAPPRSLTGAIHFASEAPAPSPPLPRFPFMPERNSTPRTPPVALLTGGAQGIGRATAPGLLRAGFRLLVVVRSEARGREVQSSLEGELGEEAGSRVEPVVADLESGDAIQAACEVILERHPRLHLLVNNAGVVTRRYGETAEGVERTLAVNHLAYVRVVRGVLPGLLAAAEDPAADVRIVQVSSDAHAKRFDLTAFQGPRGFSPYGAYAQSKLLNLYHTFDLAEALAPWRVTANALHPGLISTGLLASFFPPGPLGAPFRALSRWVGKSTEEGARTSIFAATSPVLRGMTGRYLRRETEAEPAPVARDSELRRGVKIWTEGLLGFDWREGIPAAPNQVDENGSPSASTNNS